MRISEEQVRKVLETTASELTTQTLYDRDLTASADAQLIHKVCEEILEMPEVREELVAELKARIERGEYNPSAEDIVEAMVRRAIADRAR